VVVVVGAADRLGEGTCEEILGMGAGARAQTPLLTKPRPCSMASLSACVHVFATSRIQQVGRGSVGTLLPCADESSMPPVL
jgi:hypothetical protein